MFAVLLLLLGGASALDDIEPPANYHVQEGIWIKESGSPTSAWRAYNSTSDPLILSSPTSEIDVAYVIRTMDHPPSVNASFSFYRNSDTKTRFLPNGSLFSTTVEHGCGSLRSNSTNDTVRPLHVLNLSKTIGESHLGYTYYLFLTTFNPKRHSGDIQIRVNVTGLGGGSSWSSPFGNPNVPWLFFRLPSEADVVVSPFQPGDLLRASSRSIITGTGFPFGISQRNDYEIFIDCISYANGTYYGANLHRTGRQLPRDLEPGWHVMTVVGTEVEVSIQFLIHQWDVSVEVSPNITIPGGVPVNITGRGFPVNETYSIFLGKVDENSTAIHSGAVSKFGNFSYAYSFPKGTKPGPLLISATSPQIAGPPTATAQINIDPWSVNLTCLPNVLRQSEWINITGTDYPVNSSIVVYLDGSPIYQTKTDENGTFFHRVYTLHPSYRPGIHIISANATQYGGPPSGNVEIVVKQFNATISVYPNLTHPGLFIDLRGRNFPPNELVEVSLPNHDFGDLVTDINGSFQVQYDIPKDYPTGSFNITAVSTRFWGPPTGIDDIVLAPWPANGTLDAVSPHPGGWVRIRGEGFPPDSAYSVVFDGVALVTGTTSAEGTMDISPTLPINAKLGSNGVELISPTYSGTPSVYFTVDVSPWSPTTHLSSQESRPGEAIQVSGTGFPRNREYNVTLDGIFKGTGTFAADGSITTFVFLRRNITLGSHVLNLTPDFDYIPSIELVFHVVPWNVSIQMNPRYGQSGRVVSLELGGLPPLSQLTIYWDGVQISQDISDLRGAYSGSIQINSPTDNAYHVVKVQSDPNFTGPPASLAYFWLGNNPPRLEFHTCDASGDPADVFYLGESVYVRASGLPPEIDVCIQLDSTGSSQSIPLNTGSGGSFLAQVLNTVASEGEYTVWLDVNENGIWDGNDIQPSSPLSIKARPSISVDSPVVDKSRAKQGEVVQLGADVSNHGLREEEIRVEFLYGQDLIDHLSIVIPPNATERVVLDWQTMSFETGRRLISVEVQPLPGEIETDDNRAEGTSVIIESPPDIAIVSITSESRTLKIGDVLRIQVKLENRAPIQQIFELELLWMDRVVATSTINLAGKSMKIEIISWVPDEVGEGRIRLRTNSIPYEINTADNDLAAGQVTILPPNIPPLSIPIVTENTLVGLSNEFSASESSDPDGEIAEYSWDYGDGTTDSGLTVSHVYQRTGTYQVNLTVTDDDGKSSSNFTSIAVLDPSGFLLWASDQNGVAIEEVNTGDGIYATIVSPGPFSCPLYVILSGTATDNHLLVDLRGAPTIIHMNSTVPTLVWTPTSSGLYDLALDLDRNGIYSTGYDLIHPAVLVVDQAYLLMGIVLAIAVLRRGMEEG